MTTNIYTIWDKVAMESRNLFHSRSDALAIRAFRQIFKDDMDVTDYELLKVGTFDHDKTKIEQYDIPERIYSGRKEPKE